MSKMNWENLKMFSCPICKNKLRREGQNLYQCEKKDFAISKEKLNKIIVGIHKSKKE